MCVSVLPTCMCLLRYVLGAQRGQKRVSGLLALGQQMAVSCQAAMWVLGAKPGSFARAEKSLANEPPLQNSLKMILILI